MHLQTVTALACLWALPLVAEELPEAKWDHLPEGETWTEAALEALDDHGKPLVDNVPGDIEEWCPAYFEAPESERAAFWVGFLSTLAEFESTWRPNVVGSGKWFGLLQIAPATARAYDCKARTGEALKTGASNLGCAIRIMATTIERDGVLVKEGSNWAGAAADWGPLRSDAKTSKMQTWLSETEYCSL
ncbi:Transglycosylase SLT domain-containing protein [Roseivivax lentus]|uniref:Transglycosylase SLT domain-containing protein n=1 Tax=Roseivivax lentus TaxID=633194 RepID=A0A1N7Q7H2_9RHOB|nr:transglycosylase SLT domain-containing protein [Roseivivax lentus]SIT18810.1 Transglycosylase SLT domain-containing protein [Roseivivax lentus]